jgi:hypothetical protein
LARNLWLGFADEIEGRIGPGRDLEPVRGFANKLPEHAARLAAMLTLVNDLKAPEAPETQMEAGILLARYYLDERLRIHAACSIDLDLQHAQRVLVWLQNEWKEPNRLVSLPDIYQRGPAAIRNKAKAEKIVAILEDHGWLIELVDTRPPGTFTVNGIPRRQAWQIMEKVPNE